MHEQTTSQFKLQARWLIGPLLASVGLLLFVAFIINASLPLPLASVSSFNDCWHYTQDGWGKNGINSHIKFVANGHDQCVLPDGRVFTD